MHPKYLVSLALFVFWMIPTIIRGATISVDTYAIGNGPITSYYSPQPGSPEVHLLGVYDSGVGTNFGNITVHVKAPTIGSMVPIILVFSSRQVETWHLDIQQGANIEEIILNGGNAQSIDGEGDISVINRSPEPDWLGAYAYAWPSHTGGSNTPLLVKNVEALVGEPLTSFTGGYSVSEFTIIGTTASVPEISTFVLLGAASAILFGIRARRKRS